MARVVVWPRPRDQIRGWDGGDIATAEAFPVQDLIAALEARHPTDAHFVPYHLVGPEGPETFCPRINQSALPALDALGCRVLFDVLPIDLDDPEAHRTNTPARPAWIADVHARRQRLPDSVQRHIGWYLTRGGMRLLLSLPEAVDIPTYLQALRGFRALVAEAGLEADALTDWNRCYRLPRVVRDGVPQDPDGEWYNLEDPLPAEIVQDLLRLGSAAPPTSAEPNAPSRSAFALAAAAGPGRDLRPGDVYEATTTWDEILLPLGWRRWRDRPDGVVEWTRPGKAEGISATTGANGLDMLYVFSSSAPPFTPNRTYTRFQAFAALHHGNDMTAAARALREAQRPPITDTGHAADPDPDPCDDDEGPPMIRIKVGELPRIVRELEDALAKNDIYQRGRRLVTTSRDPIKGRSEIIELGADGLHLAAAKVARWETWRSARPQSPTGLIDPDAPHGEWVPADPPVRVVADLVGKRCWSLPALVGVSGIPVLRPDGTIFDAPGYDPVTCYVYDPGRTRFPAIPEAPTQDQALAALDLLEELVCDFPFATEADRSVALAGILSAVARPALPKSPLTVVDGHTPASGKSKVVQLAAIIATGAEVAPIAEVKEEEAEKRITAILIAGAPVVLIDNVTRPVGGAAIDAMLTAEEWQGRILGSTQMVTVPNRSAWFVTGNNISVRGDLVRRAVRCYIDVDCEQPERRDSFRIRDLEAHVLKHRGRLVAAAMTIIRAYTASGSTLHRSHDLPALGGYEAWTRLVRAPLVWLGLADPAETQKALRASADTTMAAFHEFLAAWRGYYQGSPATVKQAIDDVGLKRTPEANRLREAIEELAQLPISDRKTAAKIGYEIKQRKNRRISGLKIEQYGDPTKAGRKWSVVFTNLQEPGDDGSHRHPSSPPSSSGQVIDFPGRRDQR